MKKDTLKIYILEILLFVILFFALIVLNNTSYINMAIVLSLYALISKKLLKRKKILSIYKKQVVILMFILALVYLGCYYLLGFAVNDFVKSSLTFSFKVLCRFIIPIALIIISSEVIRYVFLSQRIKIRLFKREYNLSQLFTFINLVFIDLIIYTKVYDITRYNDFLMIIGFILFASISNNLLYNYVSNRYGIIGNIVYRMITILYIYIIPIEPNILVYFKSFLRMIYPYIIYLILEKTYTKVDFVVSYKTKKQNFIWTTIMIIIMVLITMLISCQFRYGVLVIGSSSMKGTIDYGDVVLFEQYKEQVIKEGQVIIFENKGLRLVHRVVQVRSVNGQMRYYTKGDANKNNDIGYRTDNDVVGLVHFKIKYLGYPTLMLRDLFK